MSKDVQRFICKAHAMESHPKYFSWVIADLCLFIAEDNKSKSIKRAKEIFKKENWIPITNSEKSTLYEDKIIATGGDILAAYKKAKKEGYYLEIFCENWTGFKDNPPLSFPRITEVFIDKVIKLAGGNRIEISDKASPPRNADYIIDDTIFELKIIEEERLLKDSVQENIIKKLIENDIEEQYYYKNYSDFQKSNYYMNLLRKPIQNAVRSASKQIKSTRKMLEKNELIGGFIIVNNGNSSYDPDTFKECVFQATRNDTKQIDEVIIINNWVETNGFDSNYQVVCDTLNKETPLFEKIRESFFYHLDMFMNEWGGSGFSQSTNMIEPIKNISFEKYGIIFSKLI